MNPFVGSLGIGVKKGDWHHFQERDELVPEWFFYFGAIINSSRSWWRLILRKKWIIQLIVQLLLILFACISAGGLALISGGGLGGVAIGLAPESMFGLLGDYICPEGTALKYEEWHASYNRPGESQFSLQCVGQNGESKDATLPAVLSVMGLGFLVVFVPAFLVVYIPLGLLALILIALIGRKNRR
jgi:hypothetical protein